jgi:hypothetical protein
VASSGGRSPQFVAFVPDCAAILTTVLLDLNRIFSVSAVFDLSVVAIGFAPCSDGVCREHSNSVNPGRAIFSSLIDFRYHFLEAGGRT